MINLLPYKEKKSIEHIRMIRMIRTVFFGCTVLILMAGALLVPTLITVNSRFSIATNQINILQRDGTLVSSIDLAALEKRARTVSTKLAAPHVVGPTEYVAFVESDIPAGITVNRFATADTGGLSVYGVSSSRGVLQSFIKSLESDSRVASVDSAVSNFVKATNSPFTITVIFK
jgi:hypothetical protein